MTREIEPNRLREIRNALGRTQADFAGILGITVMSYSLMERGINKLIPKNARMIEQSFGLPENACFISDHLPVPIIGSAAAGLPVFSEENFDGFASMYNVRKNKFGEVVGVNIVGDSMEPKISVGDIAYIKLQDDIEHNSIGAFSLNEGIVIKKMIKNNEHIELHSLNPDYPPIVINNHDDFRVLGLLTGLYKDWR